MQGSDIMRIACFGFGYVGKAYALWLKEHGHEVSVKTAQDNTMDEARGYFFHEPFWDEYDAIVVAVPTPTINNKQDLTILRNVLDKIKKGYKTKCIIIKSTVLPQEILKLEKEFAKPKQLFVHYPEFLEAKNPIGGVFNQTCCVFGKTGKWSKKQKEFISELFSLDQKLMTFTNLTTASMLKYIHNMWLSCNVSFWNSIIRSTKIKDIDYNSVLKETHKSKYFGIHPWHIGTAYGGDCLPKDIKAFINSVKNKSVFKKFIKTIDAVNEEVKKHG